MKERGQPDECVKEGLFDGEMRNATKQNKIQEIECLVLDSEIWCTNWLPVH